jgi:uncharacterized protein (UPF0332 family)
MEEEGMKQTIQQLMDMFVEPEIKKRQETGKVEKPFPLQHAQIIFYPDGTPPQVRLNDEVKAELRVVLKEEFREKVKKGDPVYWEKIESIETTKLTDEEDPNVGHATILSINGSWLRHCNFIYNKQRSAQHIEAARQFIEAVRTALEKKHWAVLIDSLCSASELTAKAYLLGSPNKTIMESKTHGIVASRANMHRKLGNLQGHHIEAFNKAWNIRGRARYLEGELTFTEQEAVDLLKNLEEFIAYVESLGRKASNNQGNKDAAR